MRLIIKTFMFFTYKGVKLEKNSYLEYGNYDDSNN